MHSCSIGTATLEELLIQEHLIDPEEARGLAGFLTPLLQYDPLMRPEPSELLLHPWLNPVDKIHAPAALSNDAHRGEGGGGGGGRWNPMRWLSGGRRSQKHLSEVEAEAVASLDMRPKPYAHVFSEDVMDSELIA